MMKFVLKKIVKKSYVKNVSCLLPESAKSNTKKVVTKGCVHVLFPMGTYIVFYLLPYNGHRSVEASRAMAPSVFDQNVF